MQFMITGELVAIVGGAIALTSAVVAGIARLTRKMDRMVRSLATSEKQRKFRKRETAMIFRYLLSMHDGLKKCGYVNGDLEKYRLMVETYIDSQLQGAELWDEIGEE